MWIGLRTSKPMLRIYGLKAKATKFGHKAKAHAKHSLLASTHLKVN